MQIASSKEKDKIYRTDTLSYSLMTRLNISIKFKVKCNVKDKDQDPIHFYQEYLTGKDRITMNLAARSYIIFDMAMKEENGDKVKSQIYVTEVYCQRLVRKLKKIAAVFEAYDSGEADILVVDQNGTRLHSEVAQAIMVPVGVQTLIFKPFYNDESGKVVMHITSGDITVSLSLSDFILLYYKLDALNFDQLTMSLLNFYNTAPYEEHRTDLRSDKFHPQESLDEYPDFNANQYSKSTAMGSLTDIENPSKSNTTNNYKRLVW